MEKRPGAGFEASTEGEEPAEEKSVGKAPARERRTSQNVVRKKTAGKKAAASKKKSVRRPGKSKNAASKSAVARKGRPTRATAKKKASRSKSAPVAAEGKAGVWCEDPVCKTADGCRAQRVLLEIAKKKVKGSVPAIVEAMLEKAKQGSYSHAKTLLEMTGACRMFDQDADGGESGESWAQRVLERMREAEQTELHDGAPDREADGGAERPGTPQGNNSGAA